MKRVLFIIVVLDSVTSTPQWICQPIIYAGCAHTCWKLWKPACITWKSRTRSNILGL